MGTGWRSRRRRSPWPTSSAPSRARWPTSAGTRPDSLTYEGSAGPLRDVWLAVRANLRAVLEVVTVADIAEDHLPELIPELLEDPEAFRPTDPRSGSSAGHRRAATGRVPCPSSSDRRSGRRRRSALLLVQAPAMAQALLDLAEEERVDAGCR